MRARARDASASRIAPRLVPSRPARGYRAEYRTSAVDSLASLIIKTRYFTARRGTSQRNDRQFFPIRHGMIPLPIRPRARSERGSGREEDVPSRGEFHFSIEFRDGQAQNFPRCVFPVGGCSRVYTERPDSGRTAASGWTRSSSGIEREDARNCARTISHTD